MVIDETRTRIVVNVTAQDIARGVKHDPCWCPVARAIRRHIQRAVLVDVGPEQLDFYDNDGYLVYPRATLPSEAATWVDEFDTGFPVQPFSFEVLVPAQVVRHAK